MIGILGATGTVGTALMTALKESTVPIRALAHTPLSVDRLDDGVDVVVGDIHNSNDVARFLEGVSTLFLLTPATSDQLEIQNRIVDEAVDANLEALVKLSVYTAAVDSPCAFCRLHEENDRYIAQSGLPYTILHPHSFMQSIALQYASSIKAHGVIAAAVRPDAAFSMVDVRDVAEVAAAVLVKGDHRGETILITGPEAVTLPQCGELIAKAIGKAVIYEELSPQQVHDNFTAAGMTDWFAEALVALHRMYDTGELNPISDAVERFTGKPARDFAQFVDDYAFLFS